VDAADQLQAIMGEMPAKPKVIYFLMGVKPITWIYAYLFLFPVRRCAKRKKHDV